MYKRRIADVFYSLHAWLKDNYISVVYYIVIPIWHSLKTKIFFIIIIIIFRFNMRIEHHFVFMTFMLGTITAQLNDGELF